MKKKGRVKSFFGEFKTFITRGNVLDMAVGVIVGSAFTAIVTALSDHILKPLINWALAALLGSDSLSEVYTVLKGVYDSETGLLDLTQSIYIDWGAFINAIINFILIAFVLFCIVRAINNFSEAREKAKSDFELEKAAVKKYRKEGLSLSEAKAKYAEDLAKEEAAQKEAARLAEEQAAAEAAAAKEAEEAKAMANTKLLEEIRDLLKNK